MVVKEIIIKAWIELLNYALNNLITLRPYLKLQSLNLAEFFFLRL